jgi:hypothetical protein
MEELYYSHPVQVRYWDAEYHKYFGGIAYRDFLIDGCVGAVNPISVILEAAADDGKDADQAIVELDWLNLNRAILDN